MINSKKITIDGIGEVTVRELTVTQVADLMQETSEARPHYTVELLVKDAIPIEIVMVSTGLAATDLNSDISPTDANALWNAVREVNPFLMTLLDRLQKMAGQEAMPGSGSAAVSAP